ncbi:flavin-containing monooxygenase [Virgisporangium ochraceum]|uniref:flavin-containing monooxygenase n=1 Tax=Virgisporangium ochraceum TaxID=65505 RepID=UPI001EF2FF81|nr:NAD(P)/FAD-dependent oxidoreductase [Virgisporangium ochraceum]
MTTLDLVIVGGGQAGLATARTARTLGLRTLVLDASERAGGSWPGYYDSLTLFSPARFSSLPGLPFPGDPDRYPRRDEVVAYLDAYARHLDAEIRWGRRVVRVTRHDNGFVVTTDDGATAEARLVVAASGGFGTPHRPDLPGLDTFAGTVLHSSRYTTPHAFAGTRVVVVGGGNSAVQIATELAEVATVTIATRTPLRWQRQRVLGRDFHWWLDRTGLDTSPLGPKLVRGAVPVIDDGRYRAALRAGRPDHRPLFTHVDGDRLVWTDGARERVDVLILATGYRPGLAYLGVTGTPAHRGGVSTDVPGLGYVGLERQRSFASATLRGVGRDATHVLRTLVRQRRPLTARR